MQPLVRTTLLGWLLAGLSLTTGPTMSAADEKTVDLHVGDAAPAFEAIDDEGRPWKLADHVGKKFLVIYFYPGDFTPGCTTQAQKFRDNMNQLRDQGIEVIGVSGDSVQTHALFKQAQKLNFNLLADEDGKLAKQFGVPLKAGAEVRTKNAEGKIITLKRAVTAARWTFIIGKDGKVIYKNVKVDPVKDSQQVAAVIENLEKK